MTAYNAPNRPVSRPDFRSTQQPTPAPTERTLAPIKFKSDPAASTFRWEIDLTQDGVNRVAQMEGYSKGQGLELANKAELLMRKLTNPLSLYLAKCDEIRLYENGRELPSGHLVRLPKDQQPLLLTLYRDHYQAQGWLLECAPILAHLNGLYTILTATGQPPRVRSTNSRKKVWFPELDHSQYRFASLGELQVFCRSMVARHGEACMKKWWTAHLDMQPELTQPEPSGAAILHTPADSPQQQATQQATQGLYDKYGRRD